MIFLSNKFPEPKDVTDRIYIEHSGVHDLVLEGYGKYFYEEIEGLQEYLFEHVDFNASQKSSLLLNCVTCHYSKPRQCT